jgi:hypothetical protein
MRRRVVAALAKPTVEVAVGHERDSHGRFVPGTNCGVQIPSHREYRRVGDAGFELPSHTYDPNIEIIGDFVQKDWRAGPIETRNSVLFALRCYAETRDS